MQNSGNLRIMIMLALVFTMAASGRVFFTGSNPVLSSIVFPQDNLIIPGGDNISFSTSWQNFPWWGDLDEPENRPNNDYIFSWERREDYQFKQWINQYENTVSVSRWLTENKKVRFDLAYMSRKMNSEANGFSEAGPYSYESRNAIRDLYLTSVYATYYKDMPVGVKIGIGGVNTSKTHLKHLTLNGDQEGTSEVKYWGFRDGNEETQEEYGIGSPLKLDLQAAATFSKHKAGARFRYYTGKLGAYSLDGDHYDESPQKIHNYTFRLYGIYNWYKRDRFRFNTTALTRYTVLDTVGVPSSDPNIQGSKARSRQFVLQVNPNVNIFPWNYPMTYIDAAILCNYQYTRYDFIGENGRYIWTQVPTWRIEDISSEEFSFGNENFVEAALDVYAVIPVFGMKDRMAAIGISALVWRKYKWLTKHFGHVDDDDQFEESGLRKNFDREMWINTVVNLVYKQGRVMYRLDFGQPLIYSLEPKTTLYDAGGKVVGAKSKEKMWLAQSGFKVGFFISTDLENFMRYQPLARPDSRPVSD